MVDQAEFKPSYDVVLKYARKAVRDEIDNPYHGRTAHYDMVPISHRWPRRWSAAGPDRRICRACGRGCSGGDQMTRAGRKGKQMTTVGQLHDKIESVLASGPLKTLEIYRAVAATTDATIYDVVAALNRLYRAGIVNPSDDEVTDAKWSLNPQRSE